MDDWCATVPLFHFPNACRIITSTTDLSTLCGLAFWFWVCTLLGTATQIGYVYGTPFSFLHQLTFKAHFAEFLFGITLGHIYTICQANNVKTPILTKYGATIGITTLFLLYFLVDLRESWYAYTWMSNGMVSPILGIIMWSTANGEDWVLSGILGSSVMKYLGQVSFQIYIQQAMVHQLCLNFDIQQYHVPVLITLSFVLYYFAEVPLNDLVLGIWSHIEKFISPYYVFMIETLKSTEKGTTDESLVPQKSNEAECDIAEHSALSRTTESEIYAPIDPPMWIILSTYYLLLTCCICGYAVTVILHLEGASLIVKLSENQLSGFIYNNVKWAVLIGAPASLLTLLGQSLWCPWNRGPKAYHRHPIDSLKILTEKFQNKMYFRIVTRGMHPILVRENALSAIRVLNSCLPPNEYCLEIVTDNPVDALPHLENHLKDADVGDDFDISMNFREIVVNKDFQCASGAKYKARALQYAILFSSAGDSDWIVHLDEETRFDADTVKHCLRHCVKQDGELAVNKNKKKYGNIGQGVIIYGSQLSIENYITTLADSIRVGDDFGKFRMQYQSKYPWIGMHGSFVVCSNAVEREISFDHGLHGSITEDAYFALAAWSKGVKFSWIDGFMYEQSPFTIYDFILQRRRWFGGLWLVCRDKTLKLRHRLTLLFMITTWALSTFAVLITAANSFVSTGSGITDTSICISIMSAITCWSYTLGFLKTYSLSDGLIRYIVLLYLQLVLQPIFALMEIAGVIAAILSPPVKGFHIVQKEGKNVANK